MIGLMLAGEDGDNITNGLRLNLWKISRVDSQSQNPRNRFLAINPHTIKESVPFETIAPVAAIAMPTPAALKSRGYAGWSSQPVQTWLQLPPRARCR
mgnify:CR=1 FL=1